MDLALKLMVFEGVFLRGLLLLRYLFCFNISTWLVTRNLSRYQTN